MNKNKFEQYCELWKLTAQELAIAHDRFRNTKHKLEIAKAEAWADGQVTGSNNDQRKAALYIIVEPFIENLIATEQDVMNAQIEERYLRNMVEFAIWGDTDTPQAFGGIREKIDAYNPS